MMASLPDYYFRVRENGAQVFRVDSENQHMRLELEPIAFANIRNGEIRPQGDRTLSDADKTAIQNWLDERRALLARRDLDDIHRTIDHMNLTAHWANSKATDAELEDITDRLLLAMHDLRTVLVRKKSDRLQRPSDNGE